MITRKNVFLTAGPALSGGAAGLCFYLAFYTSNPEAGINYVFLSFSIIFSMILFSAGWAAASTGFARLFNEAPGGILKKCSLIFSLPLAVFPALLILTKVYYKLKNADFKVLGNVYLPFAGYTELSAGGYLFAALSGLIVVIVVFGLLAALLYFLYKKGAEISGKTAAKAVFLSLFVFYAAVTSYVTFSYPPTGDEPHYLLIAHSIAADLDVNLENNYTDDKSFRSFYPVNLEFKNIHNTPGAGGAGIYSMHSAGLPLLISGFYKIGGRYGVQLFMNVLAAFLGALFFYTLARNNFSTDRAAAAALLFFITVPLSVNSSLVLTEIPAAIIILYCVFELFSGKLKQNRILFFTGLAAMPWLHAKLIILSVVFYVYYYFLAVKRGEFNTRREAVNNIPVIVLGGALVWFYYSVYGKFVPFALVSTYVSDSFYFIFSAPHAIKAFFAVLFDRDYGLFTHNPLYIISLWGLMLAASRRDYKMLEPFFLVIPYFSLYLFWSDWGGSITPARQMIPILPIAAFYGVYFMREVSFEKTRLFKVMAACAAFISCILMAFPPIRYAASRDKIYAFLESRGAEFLWLAPSFRETFDFSHLIIIPYIIIIITLYFVYTKRKNKINV